MQSGADVPALVRLPIEVLLLIVKQLPVAETLLPLSSLSRVLREYILPIALAGRTVRCELAELPSATTLFSSNIQHLKLSSPFHVPFDEDDLPQLPNLLSVRISGVMWERFRSLFRSFVTRAPDLDVIVASFSSDWPFAGGELLDGPWYAEQENGGLNVSKPRTAVFSFSASSASFHSAALTSLLNTISRLDSLHRLCLNFPELRASSTLVEPHCELRRGSSKSCPYATLAKGLSNFRNLRELYLQGSSNFLNHRSTPCCLLPHMSREPFERLERLRVGGIKDWGWENMFIVKDVLAGSLPELKELDFSLLAEDILAQLQRDLSLPEWVYLLFHRLAKLEVIRWMSLELEPAADTSNLMAGEKEFGVIFRSHRHLPNEAPVSFTGVEAILEADS